MEQAFLWKRGSGLISWLHVTSGSGVEFVVAERREVDRAVVSFETRHGRPEWCAFALESNCWLLRAVAVKCAITSWPQCARRFPSTCSEDGQLHLSRLCRRPVREVALAREYNGLPPQHTGDDLYILRRFMTLCNAGIEIMF